MRTSLTFLLMFLVFVVALSNVNAGSPGKEYVEDPQRCEKAIQLHIGKERELAHEIKVMRVPGKSGCWIRATFLSDENWVKFMEELSTHNKYGEQLDSSPNPVKIQYNVIRDEK